MPLNVLILGASQRTGLEVARLLTQRGDHVRAFVRPTSDRTGLDACGVEYAVGDAVDAASVDAAVGAAPTDVLVCTIGGARGEPRPDVDGVRNLIAAAVAHKVSRLLLVTAVGAGDSRAALSDHAWKFLGPVIELKTQAEALLTASELDWTILRPGGMGSGPATGTAIKTEDHTAMGMIQRADLAALVVDCIDDAATVGKIFHTVDPADAELPPLQKGEVPVPGAAKP
jgi:uncharacterized protein YbjT (DUF2867 family)